MKLNYDPEGYREGEQDLKTTRCGTVVLYNDTLYLVGGNGSMKSTEPGRLWFDDLKHNKLRVVMSLNAGTIRLLPEETRVVPVDGVEVMVTEPLPPNAETRISKSRRR